MRKSKYRQHNGHKKKDKRTNNDLQNITHKTKDRVARTPLKTGGEVFMKNGTYPWSFVTQILHNGQPSHGGDGKTIEVMTST
jgi:hypothetical protein